MERLHAVEIDALILNLWRRARHGEVFASKLLADLFAQTTALTDAQRDHIVATLYGMLALSRRIDHALFSAKTPPRTAIAPAQLLTYRLLKKELPVEKAQARLDVVDWPAVLAADAALATESDLARRVALQGSMPDGIAERLAAEYGETALAIADALNVRAPLTLRVNTLRATRDQILGTLSKQGLRVRPGPLCPTAIELESRMNVFETAAFAEGQIEVQDEASQLIAELVAPPPHGLVIDYCAGAGGKTLALGALMGNRGRLVALDVNERRLEELRRRARRAGLTNARAITLKPPARSGAVDPQLRPLLGKADRVLVDAPCSGVGVFRRKPELRWRLKPDALKRLPELQEAIARAAMRLCAPGGRLIYATCTLLTDENERVVERLVAGSDFELLPIKLIFGKARAKEITSPDGNFLKPLPHQHSCDGFFAAVLRRRAN